jgi:hypothetical protein
MVCIIILYYDIVILWDHRRIFCPCLTETSLCGAYLYIILHSTGPMFTSGAVIIYAGLYMHEKTNECSNCSLNLLCKVAPTCFGITLLSSGSVPSAFWEMLNWEAVDRILWMCVAHPQYSIDWSSIEHLSEGTRNAPWGWQFNAETCRSYQT